MTREHIIIDKERGIARLTMDDERWYIRETQDPKTKEKSHIYLPSVTWICQSYPKGIGYFKWLADKGWNEAEAIKEERGKYGTKVHKAAELLLNGDELKIEDLLFNPKTGQMEASTAEEYTTIMSFVDWYNGLTNPQVIDVEHTVWNEKDGYAGTLDLHMTIDGEPWLIDLKTSQQIWPSHELQLAALKRGLGKNVKMAILQLGYRKNKKNFKFTEVEDKWSLFLAAKSIWANDHDGEKPYQKDLPLSIFLNGVKKNRSAGVTSVKEIIKHAKSNAHKGRAPHKGQVRKPASDKARKVVRAVHHKHRGTRKAA